jgi:predicted RNase H-like HicB family nuclease
MTNSMTYKGYSASIAYDDDDGLFTGRIAGIRDGVGFHADTVEALRAAFQEAVDDYFETCAKIGKGPLADYVMSDADTILTTRATELEAIDDTIMCEVAGVAQAADDVRKALDALDGLLGDRQFEKAAALGYRKIASAFIFLQRTLGGLQSADFKRHDFTSSMAASLNCAFEEAEPYVVARLECMKPRPDLTDEERAAAKARLDTQIRKMGSTPQE